MTAIDPRRAEILRQIQANAQHIETLRAGIRRAEEVNQLLAHLFVHPPTKSEDTPQ